MQDAANCSFRCRPPQQSGQHHDEREREDAEEEEACKSDKFRAHSKMSLRLKHSHVIFPLFVAIRQTEKYLLCCLKISDNVMKHTPIYILLSKRIVRREHTLSVHHDVPTNMMIAFNLLYL